MDELKEDVANGNLDPYNWGTDEDGNLYYNIYDDIEYWEEQYQSAPETKTLAEGRPVAGSQKMVLRKMNSPVLHRCRMDQNIFT